MRSLNLCGLGRNPVLAKETKGALLLFGLSIAIASGQSAPVPATPAPAPALAPPPPAATTAATESTGTALDYLYNHRAEDGSAAQAAMGIANRYGGNVGDKLNAADLLDMPPGLDDPIVRQRFLIYLKHPEVSADRVRDYLAKQAQLMEILKQGDQTFAAWKVLYAMSEYKDLDAGISRELANRVEAVWNTDRTNNSLTAKNDSLRITIQNSDRNADMNAAELRAAEHDLDGRAGNGTNAPAATPTPVSIANPIPSNPDGAGSMQLTADYLNGLETRARLKLNEVQQTANLQTAKSNFADYVTTLYGSHRYYQVVMAADFYRQLFSEGDYPVTMANQVNASLEIISNVNLAVDDFKDEAQKGQVAGGATMLQTAYLGNEFEPALQGVPLAQKEKVSEYLQKLGILKNVIEARDFARVPTLISDVTKIANDFDGTKPMAMIDAVKLESTLRLGKAKMLAQDGDLKSAMSEFQIAAEAWPGNPDLQASATGFFNNQDLKNQSVTEFDRLMDDHNYRAIAAKQLIFAPAVLSDPKRALLLKNALETVQHAEIAADKADALVLNGDVDGAWETISAASAVWPEDNKLNRLYADLSARATDFVSAINKGRDAEAKKAFGFSLTWYLNAQHIYPPSILANAGVDRVSALILSPPPPSNSVAAPTATASVKNDVPSPAPAF